MPSRDSHSRGRSVEQTVFTAALVLTCVTVAGALATAGCIDVLTSRRELADAAAAAAPRVERTMRAGDTEHALEGIGAIGSAKLYAADGKLLAETPPPRALRSGLSVALAKRLASEEIVCSGGASGETFCTEVAAAPLALRIGWWMNIVSFGALGALLVGVAAGVLLRRALMRQLAPIAATIDRASQDRDYSQRVPAGAGAVGALGTSINSLIEQVHEREAVVRRRTIELEAANKDLEGFAYAVSHDLRGPLGSITGFAQALELDYKDRLDANGREYLSWMLEGCRQMGELIEGLLEMARLARADMSHDDVDLSAIARSLAESLKQKAPERQVRFDIRDGVHTMGDARLLRAVLENLMNNAFKFTRKRADACIEFGVLRTQNEPAFYVRDNGAGFDPSQAAKMFRPFQRLHSSREFEGTGIGLATVQKIVMRHGGKAWAEGEVGKGATVYFTAGGAGPVGSA